MGELMRLGNYRGTIQINANKENAACCLPDLEEVLDDARIASLWTCNFPESFLDFYLIQYSWVDIDALYRRIYIAYPVQGIINRYQYMELMEQNTFTGS
jgi:hypothetical protein